ncbi:MAG: hypothetical protein QF573_05735 [Chloroflexota bacterium]|nr:hypothetical protein [Chloroflexota bacterium]
MRRVHIYTAILTLLLAIALVACGGSDAEAPVAAETAAAVAAPAARAAPAAPTPAPTRPATETAEKSVPAPPPESIEDGAGMPVQEVDPFALEISSDQRSGDLFAFASDRDGNLEIYTAKIDGSDVARLTNDAAADRWPAFSPDGAYLAFSSLRTGLWATFLMRIDGSGLQQISGVAGSNDLYPAFSPDGIRLAVVRDESELVIIEFAAPFNEEVIHSGALGRAFWSPDGEYVLVVDNEGREAVAVEPDGTVREEGILFPCVANKDDNHAWTAYVIDAGAAGASAFGDVLAEPCTRKGLVNDLGGGSFMFVTRFDGSEVQTIIYLQSFIAVGFPAPSPDGTGLIYTRQAGDMVNTRDILILDLENPPERGQFGDLLTKNDFNDTDPAW